MGRAMTATEVPMVYGPAREGGFVAVALGHSIATEAETLDELRGNAHEAAECHLGRPVAIRLMTWADLLTQRIAESGLSTTGFAERVLIRESRTIYRWLAGQVIPRRVRNWLAAPEEHPWP